MAADEKDQQEVTPLETRHSSSSWSVLSTCACLFPKGSNMAFFTPQESTGSLGTLAVSHWPERASVDPGLLGVSARLLLYLPRVCWGPSEGG